MKSTIKMAEGLALGVLIGGTAWAIVSSRMNARPDTKRKVSKAVKSACDFIGEICS